MPTSNHTYTANSASSMAYCFGLLFFFLTLCFAFQLQFNLSTAQTYLAKFCSYPEYYDQNSTYEANLNLLVSSINNTSRFYNSSVGESPNTVSGIFRCRGDIAPDDCNKCAKYATSDIKHRCPLKKEMHIWYDNCWLSISNKMIISVMLNDPKRLFSNGTSLSADDPNSFSSILNSLFNGLVEKSIANSSTNMFATGKMNISNTQPPIYGLVQCSQDISGRDCERCLQDSINLIPTCCERKADGTVVKPSCILWFDVDKFFLSQAIPIQEIIAAAGERSTSFISNFRIAVFVVIVMVTFTCAIYYCLHRRKITRKKKTVDDSLQFKPSEVQDATNNFSHDNILGRGGFGIVYKGLLLDGKEIAVKRLSTNSNQGLGEFKNEVYLLAKLQHRNLVRLLGFCLEGVEKLLIYEFVPNASLDHFIFDPLKCAYLSWEERFKIICGIARGLLYLHEDSQHRIIHRDLKASNILLDAQMDPKISDFGMARLCEVDQTRGNTGKIVGTYGYMAPEYALHGHFSMKADIFSFGVLVLEIITGKKTTSFFESKYGDYLLSYAWNLWKDGRALQLIDPILEGNYSADKVIRCIHIGLLCVQEDVALRPTMATIISLINRDSIALPLPLAPAFITKSEIYMNDLTLHSTNHVSMTELCPR